MASLTEKIDILQNVFTFLIKLVKAGFTGSVTVHFHKGEPCKVDETQLKELFIIKRKGMKNLNRLDIIG